MNGAAMAMLALSVSQPTAEAATTPETLTFEQALRTFRQVCVDTLPSPRAFTSTMNTIGVRWRRVDKTPAEIFGTGNSWRSTLGEVTYHNPPYSHITLFGPACHLVFRTDDGYAHAPASAMIGDLLGLPAGTDTGRTGEPQTRWEAERENGMRIRVFLTSNVNAIGGRAARLSISVRRPLPPELERRIRENEN
jgi:hypothetical protein